MSAEAYVPITTIQDTPPNFRDEDGNLFLVRCFVCSRPQGRENWAPAVATGTCAWCGWSDRPATPERDTAGERE